MRWIFLLTAVCLLAAACQRESEETVESNTNELLPDQESWDANLVITNEGRKVGVVRAAHIEKYNSKNLTLISDGLKVDFFNNEGQHTSVLTSEGGKVNDNDQNMTAYGNVVVVSDSGMTLYTDTLIWNNDTQKIISHIPVKIISEGDTLYGDSFISDANLENYEITNSRGSTNRVLRK